jgi:hypothetical protein
MTRCLQILFRRDPTRDRRDERIHFEGYQVLWPDGRPVSVGVDALCTQGQRLFGLGRHLSGCREKLLEVYNFPLDGVEADLTRLPGARVRRFFIERDGWQGRIHFMDGTPTAVVFELGRDEPAVLHFFGLPDLNEGERCWFDMAALPVGAVHGGPRLAAPLDGARSHAQTRS